jgi:hypothetical protein
LSEIDDEEDYNTSNNAIQENNMKDEMITNPLDIQNKIIEPASNVYDSINRDIQLANYDNEDLMTARMRENYSRQIESVIVRFPEYNVGNRLILYKENHIDHRNYFDAVSSGGKKGFRIKALNEKIVTQNVHRKNELTTPETRPIFSKPNRNDYQDY